LTGEIVEKEPDCHAGVAGFGRHGGSSPHVRPILSRDLGIPRVGHEGGQAGFEHEQALNPKRQIAEV
jgi:hypothetical protein